MKKVLSDAAMDAVKSAGSVQAEVRDLIANNPSHRSVIAEEIGVFKTKAEATYIDGDAVKRKQVNNVINDVSRICREEGGYSIRLKSRKGGFVYHAVDNASVAPRKVSKPKPKPSAEPIFPGKPPITTEEAIDWVKRHPQAAVNALVEMHRDQLTDMIRRAVAAKGSES